VENGEAAWRTFHEAEEEEGSFGNDDVAEDGTPSTNGCRPRDSSAPAKTGASDSLIVVVGHAFGNLSPQAAGFATDHGWHHSPPMVFVVFLGLARKKGVGHEHVRSFLLAVAAFL
jgi:hypothetical protein